MRKLLTYLFILGVTIQGQTQSLLNLDMETMVIPAAEINTKHLEFAPMYYGNGIIYVFAKEQERYIDINLGMPFFELMYSELGPDGLPTRSMNFSPNIRTRYHEGPSAFNADETRIYFTRSNYRNGQAVQGSDGKIHLKIYTADKGPEDWENIREMPFCSDDYSVWSPTLSADGSTMIFMSDVPGGFGGWDLYASSLQNGRWTDPVNLGPEINTPEHERFPYLHPNGTLFFCSEGHQGLGGLDLFASREAEGHWLEPLNMGAPFNSRKDDLTIIVDLEGKSGFFASSRKSGLGKDDIYAFSCSESLFDTELYGPMDQPANLLVRDAISGAPVSGALLWAFPADPNSPVNIERSSQTTPIAVTAGDGTAQVAIPGLGDAVVVVEHTGYVDTTFVIARIAARDGKTRVLEINPSSAIPVSRDCQVTSGDVLTRSTRTPVGNATISIENQCTQLVQIIQADAQGKFTVCLSPECTYYISVDKEGYLTESFTLNVMTDELQREVLLVEEDLEARTGSIREGDLLVLRHVFYDFDKSAIRTGDTRELESLAALMTKYPAMEIELLSHTDARGSADYNMELSERRAASVLEFLAARGISRQRITPRPMGETSPYNNCIDGVPCTESQHQENRRTEIRVINLKETGYQPGETDR